MENNKTWIIWGGMYFGVNIISGVFLNLYMFKSAGNYLKYYLKDEGLNAAQKAHAQQIMYPSTFDYVTVVAHGVGDGILSAVCFSIPLLFKIYDHTQNSIQSYLSI